ncbi:F-box-like domain protein [Rhizoctonia solani AG-3 Rhs1AP]|uniref:F-box-like domain protein n=1 Tax=Rhizoctonia solani AG-3 Rhs1AP TaxID=1086054 RepID=X8JH64_9AGAM|nr:F-box-like domain protein [Rhizoctonia solani AG-3 Rhs1AP]
MSVAGLIPASISKEFIDSITNIHSQLQTSRFMAISAITLLVYDWLTTLDKEMKFIWGRKWSFARVVYHLNRVLPLLLLSTILIPNILFAPSRYTSTLWCGSIVSCLMRWVLWLLIPALILTVGHALTQVTLNIGKTVYLSNPLPGVLEGCLVILPTNIWLAYLSGVLYESLVFGLLVWRIYRLSNGVGLTPLLMQLLKHGASFFAVNFGLMLISCVGSGYSKTIIVVNVSGVLTALSSIMCSRIFFSMYQFANLERGIHHISACPPPASPTEAANSGQSSFAMETVKHGKSSMNLRVSLAVPTQKLSHYKMSEELKDARENLEHALERYLAACATVRNQAQLPLFSHTQEHSTRMADEMAAIVACEKNIGRAKKFISQAINHSPFVARVNGLPDEILGRIFHITLGLQPCFTNINDPDLNDERKSVAFAQVPERLSHVCSRWRRLACSLPNLWQHIDINTDASDDMTRAYSRMNRAGRLLLDVHIIGSLLDVDDLNLWIASAAPRMKSFTLIICDQFETHESVLATCFRNCSPGTLEHLTIWKECASGPSETTLILYLDALSPDFSSPEFEPIFRQLKSLRLRQVYPYWTSQAYHGLSELHLASHQISQSELLNITITQLVAILQSSPKLRVLRLDLKVSEDQRDIDGLPTPVRLDDLEVLDLSSESRKPSLDQIEHVLPLLAPGTKPLQLTIDDLDEEKHLVLEEVVQAFFTRSNVTRLKLVCDESDYKEIDFELMSRLAPQLQQFVLDHYSWVEYSDNYVGSYPRFHERDNSAPDSRIDYLYLHYCEVDLEGCSKLLKDLVHPPRVLVFWRCSFLQNRERTFDKEEIRHAFEGVCQDVRILKWDTPKPPDDWASSDGMPCIY